MQEERTLLADIVLKSRHQVGWTQEALAEKSGVDSRTIMKIEQAETNPKFSTLFPLIRSLRIDPRVIFNHEKAEMAPTLYHLFEVLKDCTEEEAQSALNMVLIFLSSVRGEGGYILTKK